MNFVFSRHAKERMQHRNIPTAVVNQVLQNPQQILHEADYHIYQSVITFIDGEFLLRIFINYKVHPQNIITVYRTSKLTKYYESKI